MGRERRQKKKSICCIAQLCNPRESSTYFSPKKKKRKENIKTGLLQHCLQIMLVEWRSCLGRGSRERRKWVRYFPLWEQPINSCSALDAFSWGCAVIVQAWASKERTPEHVACHSNIEKTRYQSLFLEGLLRIEPSIRLQGLALFKSNCSV